MYLSCFEGVHDYNGRDQTDNVCNECGKKIHCATGLQPNRYYTSETQGHYVRLIKAEHECYKNSWQNDIAKSQHGVLSGKYTVL